MKKKYIILGIVILVYVVIAVVIGMITAGNKKYIIFFDGKNLKYDKNWSVTNNSVPDKTYNIVKDGVVEKTDKISFMSDLADEAVISRNIFAYSGNMKVVPYKKEEIKDFNFVNEILNVNNIDINLDDVSRKYLYNIDINKDSINEEIYVISNTDRLNGDLFSIIIVRNRENYAIIDIKKFDSEFGSYFPSLYLIDVDSDGRVEIILKKIYASNEGQKINILKVKEDIKDYDVIFRED